MTTEPILTPGDRVEIVYPGAWQGKRGTCLRWEEHPFRRAGCSIIWELDLETEEKPWVHETMLRRVEDAR